MLLPLLSIPWVKSPTTRTRDSRRPPHFTVCEAFISLCLSKLPSSLSMSKLCDCSGTYTNKYLIFCLHQRSFISGTDQQQINFTLPTQSKYISISHFCRQDWARRKRLKDNLKSNMAHPVLSSKLITLWCLFNKNKSEEVLKIMTARIRQKRTGRRRTHFVSSLFVLLSSPLAPPFRKAPSAGCSEKENRAGLTPAFRLCARFCAPTARFYTSGLSSPRPQVCQPFTPGLQTSRYRHRKKANSENHLVSRDL